METSYWFKPEPACFFKVDRMVSDIPNDPANRVEIKTIVIVQVFKNPSMGTKRTIIHSKESVKSIMDRQYDAYPSDRQTFELALFRLFRELAGDTNPFFGPDATERLALSKKTAQHIPTQALQKLLNQAVQNELYEEAAVIHKEMIRRTGLLQAKYGPDGSYYELP